MTTAFRFCGPTADCGELSGVLAGLRIDGTPAVPKYSRELCGRIPAGLQRVGATRGESHAPPWRPSVQVAS